MPTIHRVTFERNVITGQWRAQCSCLWGMVGSEIEVKRQAAIHDIEWLPAPAAASELSSSPVDNQKN